MTKQLYIKQKVFSLCEKFTGKDQEEKDVYYVEGSFMKIQKTFSIMNQGREEVAPDHQKGTELSADILC